VSNLSIQSVVKRFAMLQWRKNNGAEREHSYAQGP